MQVGQAVAMSKYIRFLWKYFLISSVVALLLHNVGHLIECRKVELKGLWDYSYLAIFLWGPATILFWKSHCHNLLLQRLVREFTLLRVQRMFCLVVFTFGILLLCLYSTSVVWRDGGRCCAHGLSYLGFVEQAERIFNLTTDRENRSFIDLWCNAKRPATGQTENDFEKQLVVLDNVIARVYGANSRIMARRYNRHADAIYAAFEDHSLALVYGQRAQHLSEVNADWDQSLAALMDNFYIQCKCENWAEVRQAMIVGRTLLAKANYSPNSTWAFSSMVFCAKSIGLDVSSDEVLLARHKPVRIAPTPFCWQGLAIMLFPFTAPYVLLMLVNVVVVRCANRKWLSASRKSTSVPDYLVQMEKLKILELALGNTAKADEYSRQSLAMATAWKI